MYPLVARRMPKWYSSSCQVFFNIFVAVHCTAVRRISNIDNFLERWSTPTLGFLCTEVPGWIFFQSTNYKGWLSNLSSALSRYYSCGFFLLVLRQRQDVSYTKLLTLKNWKLECKCTLTGVMLQHLAKTGIPLRYSPSYQKVLCLIITIWAY